MTTYSNFDATTSSTSSSATPSSRASTRSASPYSITPRTVRESACWRSAAHRRTSDSCSSSDTPPPPSIWVFVRVRRPLSGPPAARGLESVESDGFGLGAQRSPLLPDGVGVANGIVVTDCRSRPRSVTWSEPGRAGAPGFTLACPVPSPEPGWLRSSITFLMVDRFGVSFSSSDLRGWRAG